MKHGRDDKDFKCDRKIALQRLKQHRRSSEPTKQQSSHRRNDELDDSLLDSLDSDDDFEE